MNQQHKDDGIQSLFNAMDEPGGTFGMDERIMRAIEAEAAQQAVVRKHLGRALIGVAASIVVVVFFLLSTSGLFGRPIPLLSFGGFSDVYTILLSLFALFLLFVELELVVKYWYRKEVAE